MPLHFDFQEIASAFVIMFAVIDITGSIPIILNLQKKTNNIHPGKAALYSLGIFLLFLTLGNAILDLFSIDVESFAVAGGLILFVMAIEMTFGVELMKFDGPEGTATVVPLVFPMIAGPGSFTTLLAIRAEYNILNILIALILNIIFVYFVIRFAPKIEKLIGKGGVYVLRKFFGIILLAISLKLFTSNLTALIDAVHKK